MYPNPFQPNRTPFVRNQLRLLSERHALRVISPISWVDELSARWRGAPALPAGRTELNAEDVRVDYPRYWYSPGLLRQHYGRFYYRSVRSSFRRAVDEFRPELVFTSWAYPDGWAAVKLAREARLPVVLKVHGSDVLLLDQHSGRKGPTIEALRGADGVIAVSQDLASRLISHGIAEEKIRVVYNGVNQAIFYPGSKAEARGRLGLDEGKTLLLFVGNLVPVKAIPVLLEACKLLKEKGRAFELNILGQGPLRAALEANVQSLGLKDHVRFRGGMPQAQLGDWYRASDLVVLSSKSEGVPNVLIEASACGTPFVATNVGGIPEIAERGRSKLVESGSPLALAQGIEVMLVSEPLSRYTTDKAPSAYARTEEEASTDQEEFLSEVVNGFHLLRTTSV